MRNLKKTTPSEPEPKKVTSLQHALIWRGKKNIAYGIDIEFVESDPKHYDSYLNGQRARRVQAKTGDLAWSAPGLKTYYKIVNAAKTWDAVQTMIASGIGTWYSATSRGFVELSPEVISLKSAA